MSHMKRSDLNILTTGSLKKDVKCLIISNPISLNQKLASKIFKNLLESEIKNILHIFFESLPV